MLKHLRNVARNIAHKFSISANHFAYLALSGYSKTIVLDFITNEISPREYSIDRNYILLNQCKVNLERLVSQREREMITRAYLTVTFSQPNSSFMLSGNYELTLELANGKKAIGTVNSLTLAQA